MSGGSVEIVTKSTAISSVCEGCDWHEELDGGPLQLANGTRHALKTKHTVIETSHTVRTIVGIANHETPICNIETHIV